MANKPLKSIKFPGLNDTYTVPEVDATLATTGAAADAKKVGDEINDLKADLIQTQAEISSISISGFGREYVDAEATVVAGAYIDVNGNPVSVPSWSYCYLDVSEGETYKVTGVAGTGGRLYVLKDANGAVIDKYQSEINVNYVDLEYTIPENGAVLYVNTLIPRIAVPAVKKISYHFVNNNTVGSVTVTNNSGSEYTITAGKFSHVVDLYGSANGTFTFKNLNLSGSMFKPVNDDITPINLGTVGYVGANHGYIWVYSCTISGHGLTVTDIGKTSTDGTNTWILLQVTDANIVVVGCYDASAWFRLKRVAPTALNFGGSDLTVSNATLAQLYPSVKNVTVVIDDSDSEKCVVSEQYDIINAGSGIEAIKTNVGSNTNKSIATLADSIARVCNVYEFQANGAVVIYASTKILKTDIITNFVSFIQSGAFTTNDSIWIPETTQYGGVIPETGTQIDLVRTKWIDQTKPPQEYIQTNGNANSTTKAMILGYIINNGRNESISDTAGFISTVGKMYPHFAQPKSELSELTDFNTISYRIPVAVNDFVTISGFGFSCGYVVIGKDIYLFINTILSNGYVDFPVPSFMQGKKIEVIMSKNMECQSKVSTRIVSLKYTTRGSVILRLYD